MDMVAAWLFLLGAGLLAAWALARLAVPRVTVIIAGADPYAAEVAQFRREVHDWDRRG